MIRTTAWAALVSALCAAAPVGAQRFADRNKKQDTDEATNWAAEVERACTARRYGLQLAASRKVAEAGDAAVPAILTWAEEHGQNALPAIFVNAIADATPAGPATLAMLRGWADDRDFYWRAQALRGLAERRQDDDRTRFEHGLEDPSYIYRTFAGKGLLQLGNDADRDRVARALLDDRDPRVPPAIAGMLLDLGDERAVQTLVDALAYDQVFLGDPWGGRTAVEAFKALVRWLEIDVDWPRGDAAARAPAIETLLDAIRQREVEVTAPEPGKDPGADAVGGLEVRSCRNGDLFLRWGASGKLFVGLRGETGPELGTESAANDAAGWPKLRQFLTRDPAMATYGVVICDFVRIVDTVSGTSVKAAPAALPEDLSAGLKRIAAALDEKGSKELGEALRERLRQFAAESH